MKKILIIMFVVLLLGSITGISLKNYEKKGELKEISAKKLCKAEADLKIEKKLCKDENKKTKLNDTGIQVDILEHNQTGEEILRVRAR